MSYENQARDLKAEFDNLIKLHKKHEKMKKNGNKLDTDFFFRDKELNNKISIFFKEYGNFIKPRKNSLGTFKMNDYILYQKISNKKDELAGYEITSKNTSLNYRQNLINSPDASSYHSPPLHNMYVANEQFLKKSSPKINLSYHAKNTERSPTMSNWNFANYQGFSESKTHIMNVPHLNKKINEKNFLGVKPNINIQGTKTTEIAGKRIINKSSPKTSNFLYNNPSLYAQNPVHSGFKHVQQPLIRQQNQPYQQAGFGKRTSPKTTEKSPVFGRKILTPAHNVNKNNYSNNSYSTIAPFSFVNTLNTSPIISPPILNMSKTAFNLYNSGANSKKSFYQPHLASDRYKKNMYGSMTQPLNTYGYENTNKRMHDSYRMNGVDSKFSSSSCYDRYVQNQLSINDIIKSKKLHAHAINPVVLNKCTVYNKKINLVDKTQKVPEKISINSLFAKPIDKKSEILLYEICDNFIEHMIVSTGELVRNKGTIDIEDLKFMLKMDFDFEVT